MTSTNLGPQNLSGPQKAAIFLLVMGEEFTISFFKKLDQRSIKSLGKHMSEISYISAEVLNTVMAEFLKNFRSDANLAVSGRDFLEQVVSNTLDPETAREVFKVIGDQSHIIPFEELTSVPADNLVNIISGEHPQTISLILTHLPQEKAAAILNLLPETIKADVALRILTIGKVQDDLIRDLDEALKKDLGKVGIATKEFDGVETLANILNEVDGQTEEYLMSQIEEEDSDLAEAIRQKMFVFEDLLQIDTRSFREILQNVDNDTVAKALKTATEELKEMIFSNLSERAAEMLREDMEVMGPVRLKEVEESQQTILRVAKRLEQDGTIVLASKGKEDIFV
jgi:flagellar motor switch protein FliG